MSVETISLREEVSYEISPTANSHLGLGIKFDDFISAFFCDLFFS